MLKLFRIPGFIPYTLIVFLNAFVDLGHKIVVQNTIFKAYEGQTQIVLTAIVNALILLPFVMMFTPAGYLADKYPKQRIMRYSAWVAVGLTGMITLCYYFGQFWLAFAMTFLLAVQSAFYSPAKYGYIKELTGKGHLTEANGIVQAITTIAILLGTLVFSILFENHLTGMTVENKDELIRTIAPLGWFLILGALVELVASYTLPQKQPVDEEMQFDWQRYRQGGYLSSNLKLIHGHSIIWLSIVGLAIFWAICQVVLAAFPAFAKEALGVTNTVVIQGMMTCAGVGIMLGSLIAGKVSKGHIETGLIPVGALGVAASLTVMPMLSMAPLLGLNFLVLGLFGGLFIIPLNALIQFHASEHERGTVLAGNNLIQNVVMLSFLGLTVGFAWYGVSSIDLFYLLAAIALVGAIYTMTKLPQSLIHLLISRVMTSQYRLQVLGFDNIPERDGVLMLGNHISWVDWALVQMACPRRVRFVMYKGIYQRWYLKWFLDLFGVVPIAGGTSKSALKSVTDLLNQGEVVCLFPEGSISRTGQLAGFQRGYEIAAASAHGVILPFHLRGLWGSRFSRSSTKLKQIRRYGSRRDIVVTFGEPLPTTTQTDALKQCIFELSIHAWEHYARHLPTLPAACLDTAARMGGEMAAADSVGTPLNYRSLATAMICFSRLIVRHSKEQNVGLLLPTSTAGAITNMAVLLCGKTVVNLNFTANQSALKAAINKAEIQTVYTSRKFLKKLSGKGIDLEAAFVGLNIIYLEELKEQIKPATKTLTLLLIILLPSRWLKRLYCKQRDPESTAAILFSSGSEGEPKGVMLSHRNIMTNVKQVSDALNLEESDVVMATLPLFHAFGLTVTTFMPLVEGIPMICHPDPTDGLNIAKAVARYQATILCATSTFLRLYTKNPRIHPLMLESLRIVIAGAEKLSQDVHDAFKLKFNKALYEGYGATETAPVASANVPNQLETEHFTVQLGGLPGTVGMPLPGTSFRIVDPLSLRELSSGEDGLILIGGPQVMKGYLKAPDKTAEVITKIDGIRWYKTGDKGHLDKDGMLTIVDRYSRFAKIGGEMISLTSVEEQVRAALAQPELELVAVPLPDPKKGEKIVLLISGAVDATVLKERLLKAKCNPLMLPSTVYSVDEISKLGSGKTDFSASKKLAMELSKAV